MAITKEELQELMKEPNADIEKITTLSDDGRNLLTRVPKDIVDDLKLNKEQKEAIEHQEGPLLIVAGAGTGKTTVLTQRVFHLFNDLN